MKNLKSKWIRILFGKYKMLKLDKEIQNLNKSKANTKIKICSFSWGSSSFMSKVSQSFKEKRFLMF